MKKFKRLAYVACGLALAAAVAFTAVPAQAAAKKKTSAKKYVTKISSVKVGSTTLKKSGKTVALDKGVKVTVKSTVAVKGKASKKVTYKSSNNKVATISKNGGTITPKKAGTVKFTITTKDKNKKGKPITFTFKGKVYSKYVTAKAGKTKMYISDGKKPTTTLTVTPKGGLKKSAIQSVKSNKSSVVSVKKVKTKKSSKSVKYTLTGKKAGNATITVKTKGTHAVKVAIKVVKTSLSANVPKTMNITDTKADGYTTAKQNVTVTVAHLDNSRIRVKSNNTDIVAVTKVNNVIYTLTARKPGKATITVTSSNTHGAKRTKTYTVEVKSTHIYAYAVETLKASDDTTYPGISLSDVNIENIDSLLKTDVPAIAKLVYGETGRSRITINVGDVAYTVEYNASESEPEKSVKYFKGTTEIAPDAIAKILPNQKLDKVTITLPSKLMTPFNIVDWLSSNKVSLEGTYTIKFKLNEQVVSLEDMRMQNGVITFTTGTNKFEATLSAKGEVIVKNMTGDDATLFSQTNAGKAILGSKVLTK